MTTGKTGRPGNRLEQAPQATSGDATKIFKPLFKIKLVLIEGDGAKDSLFWRKP